MHLHPAAFSRHMPVFSGYYAARKLTEQRLADLFQMIPDLNMLRTDFLTFTAFDTFCGGSFAVSADQP